MAKAEQGAPSIFETDEKLEHAFRGIKLLEGASSKRVPVLRPPDYDREPGCDCPRSELEIGGRGHYSDCDTVTTRECENCGQRKPIEEMSTVFLPGTGESFQCEQCRGGP